MPPPFAPREKRTDLLQGFGFRVQDLESGVWSLEFGVQGLGLAGSFAKESSLSIRHMRCSRNVIR